MTKTKEPETDLGGEVQSQGNRTSDARLSCTVGSDDHVEIRARPKLDVVICDKIAKLNVD